MKNVSIMATMLRSEQNEEEENEASFVCCYYNLCESLSALESVL